MSTHESIAGSVRVISDESKKTANGIAFWEFDDLDHVDEGWGTEVPLAGFLDFLENIMSRVKDVDGRDAVPCLIGYELAFDLSPVWRELSARFRIVPMAKTPHDIYKLSLYPKGGGRRKRLMTFWDVKHLDRRGRRVLSESIGIAYPEDALGEARLVATWLRGYRDRNGIAPDKLGTKVLTQTSAARTKAAETIGQLSVLMAKPAYGPTEPPVGIDVRRSLLRFYAMDASKEAPRTYAQYAMRKACNRGGLTFVAAAEAGILHPRTIAIDEVSAHHAQAIGRMVPERFREVPPRAIQHAAETVVRTSLDDVLARWAWPFPAAFHAEIEFRGLRLRPGSIWEREEIGIVSASRLADRVTVEGVDDDSAVEAEAAIRREGYRDRQEGGVQAFAKLMSAERYITWVTEQELWNMAQVYSWDSMTVLRGELTGSRKRPDDFCILSSMSFYDAKAKAKARRDSLPEGPERDQAELEYVGLVKAAFNSIGYGIHARDELRPGWTVDDDGEWHLEEAVTPKTFDDKRPKHPKAWYAYGLRIAGGARMQLVMAIELIDRAFGGGEVRLVAGDTDSLKLATELPAEDILAALEPLHAATRRGIARTTSRARRLFPDLWRDMPVGEFELEDIFARFYAPWPKAALGIRNDGSMKLTLAGVPRVGEHSFAAWLHVMVQAFGEDIIPRAFSWDVTLSPRVSQVVSVRYPEAAGELAFLDRVFYTLGETSKVENAASIRWQRQHGRTVRVDGSAVCDWTTRGAVFSDGLGMLEAPECHLPRR